LWEIDGAVETLQASKGDVKKEIRVYTCYEHRVFEKVVESIHRR